MSTMSDDGPPTLIDLVSSNPLDGLSTMDAGVEPAITGEPPEERA
jgi:hypothetical protein